MDHVSVGSGGYMAVIGSALRTLSPDELVRVLVLFISDLVGLKFVQQPPGA